MKPAALTADTARSFGAARPPGTARPLLGRGRVWHCRLRPVKHAFSHASYFLLLPMRSLRAQPHQALHRNRFGMLSFHDRDHGEGGDDALAWLDNVLAAAGVSDAQGEVWLQTYPRVLGHVFKPVSFWYAHRSDGALAAVVAEVNNTFGQRHCYLLQGPDLRWGGEMQADKAFHVSPFFSVAGRYRFKFVLDRDASGQAQHLAASIDLIDDQGALLRTRQSGALQTLDPASRWRAFLGVPLMSLVVLARIHWHALRLLIKGLPFHTRPPAPEHFVSR